MSATASLTLSAANTLVGANANRSAANAAIAQGNFEKNIADQQAKDAIARGEQDANRLGGQARALRGAERAAAGASGVDVNSGSAADVQDDTSRLSAMDQLMIRHNAAREAWGFQTQGKLDQMAGENRAQADRARATSTLLTGASDLYSQWQKNPPSFSRRPSSSAPQVAGGYVNGSGRDMNPNHGLE